MNQVPAALIVSGRWSIERFEERDQCVLSLDITMTGANGWNARAFLVNELNHGRPGRSVDTLVAEVDFTMPSSSDELDVLAEAMKLIRKARRKQ